MSTKSSRETKSRASSHSAIAPRRWSRALVSSAWSQDSISGVFSPMRSLCSACRLGSPPSIRTRRTSRSACFISPIDSSYSLSLSRFRPRCSYIRACRKYWLIAVSSLVSCLLSASMTLPSPASAEGFFVAIVGSSSLHVRATIPKSATAHRNANRSCRVTRGVFGSGAGRFAQLLFEHLAGAVLAEAAAGAHPELLLEVVEAGDAELGARADLLVGNGVAHTDDHDRYDSIATCCMGEGII